MADSRQVLSFDGQAVSWNALQFAYNEAGLSKDRMLAELLRLRPYGASTTQKAILPFGVQTPGLASPSNVSLVEPGPSAAFPIRVHSFTGIVGSRNLPSLATSPDPVDTSSAVLGWRDLRSQVFASLASDGSSYGYDIPASAFAPGAGSGPPRWDLVYAQITIETSAPTILLVKPPVSGAAAPTTCPGTITTTIAILVEEGTVGTPPPLTATPADTPPSVSGGSATYNIPLALVYVPGGYVQGTTTFATTAIANVAPVVSLAQATGVLSSAPVSANAGYAGMTLLLGQGNTLLSPTMVGEVRRRFLFDATATPGSALVTNGAVIDNSIDWRNRYTEAIWQSSSADFASNPAASGNHTFTPAATVGTALPVVPGQTFAEDSGSWLGHITGGDGPSPAIVAGGAGTVLAIGTNAFPLTGTNYMIGLYVPLSGANAGNLMLLYQAASTAPGLRFFFRIDASGPLDNY